MPITNSLPTDITGIDVTIVGAGMVGLSLARRLLQQGLSVALLDWNEMPSEFSETIQSRVSAITRRSQNWLSELGAWQLIPPSRLSAYRTMQVWDSNKKAELIFSASDLAQPNLGHIIENSVICRALLEAIESEDWGNHWLCLPQVKAQKVEIDADEARLYFSNKNATDVQIIHSKLLVGADGARSWLRQQMSVAVSTHPYQQLAMVALIESGLPHKKTASQKFTEFGPLAFLPMKAAHLYSIVWSCDQGKANELLSLDEDQLLQQISMQMDHRFGSLKLASPLAHFPLVANHARCYTGKRFALIGDAAHTIHPLAGQGVNLGFLDAAKLSEILEDTVNRHQDIGSVVELRAYERARRGDNALVQNCMTAFQQGFAYQQGLLATLRNTGMNWINDHALVKQSLIRRAMGVD